jgi:hypothetical protein
MTNNKAEGKMTALKTMVEKLDTRQPDSSGYVTNGHEVRAILDELSPNVTASVVETSAYGSDISVTLTLRFTLDRSEL